MTLQFSAQPGCWERHIQRRYNNPLFASSPTITAQTLQAAQQRDATERLAFEKGFTELLEETSSLDNQVEAEVILRIKQRIDSLYEQCAGLGGDYQQAKTALRKLVDIVMQAIKSSSADKPELLTQLEEETFAREMHFQLLEHSLVAHLLHPETPISEEDIVPTLLSEEESGLRAAMSLFTPEQQQILCDAAEALLNQREAEGVHLPTARQQWAVMCQPLLQPH